MLRHRRPTLLGTLLAVLLSTVVPSASIAADRSPRVVNGEQVADPDAPYMAFITFDGFACGGSLIHPSWVLTAGHCVTDFGGSLYGPGEFGVTLGRENLNDGGDGEFHTVTSVVRHPGYDNSSLANDVALLELATPSSLPVIRLANQAQTAFEAVGTDVIVQGYGLTSGGGSASNVLLETDLQVNTDGSCQADSTGPGTMCAGDLQGGSPIVTGPNNDSCNGDSGGPLVHDDPTVGRRQVGIVSYGPGNCGYEEGGLDAGGYARVSFFEDFIHDHVGIMAFVDDVADVEGTSATDRTVAVPVSLSRAPEGGDATTVLLSSVTSTADADDFAEFTDAPVTFTGTDTASLGVDVRSDAVEETDETFGVVAGAASPITVVQSGTVTIVDDDGAGLPAIDVSATTVAEGDSGVTPMTVTATLSRPALGSESVRVRSDAGTATSATDYVPFDQTVTFAAGERTVTRTLDVNGDTDDEPNETISFIVDQLVDIGPGGTTGTGTILDDDGAQPVTVTATTADVAEGGVLVVDLSLDTPAIGGESITVTVHAPDGQSRTAGEDFLTTSTTVVLPANATSGVATFPTTDDDLVEPDESFVVRLTSSDVLVVTPTLTATILDDDDPVVPVAKVAPVTVEEGAGQVTIQVTLSAPAPERTTLRLRSTGGTATPDVDHRPLDTTLSFAAGATTASAQLAILDDLVVEPSETVSLTATSDDLTIGDIGVVTITDDDVRTVARRAGQDRIATALATSTSRPAGSSSVVYLASAASYPDALVGTPLAHRDGAPLLLTPPDALDARVLTEIRRVLVSTGGRVRLLGGPSALSVAVADAVRNAGFAQDRLSGDDRFQTATRVAAELGDVDVVFLATGRNFPDALAAGAAAAATNGAVLLTDDSRLPGATALHLGSSDADEVAVGGAAAAARPSAEALVGEDRFATAALVAERFLPDAPAVGLASGRNFPDALAGGVEIAALGGALLLTEPDALSPASATRIRSSQPSTVLLFGGPAALSPTIESAVLPLLDRR